MKYILSSLIFIFAVFVTNAKNDTSNYPDPMNLSIDENIDIPKVPSKAKSYIISSIDQLRRLLVKNGLIVESIRDDEALLVTMPCSELFAPCTTNLKSSAGDKLKNLAIVAKESSRYKMLIAVHSDDTGDNLYSDSITAARANAIDEYFWRLVGEKETNIIPYGLGKDEPIVSNSSRTNREKNRRVEFYIIPDKELLRMAGVKIK